jgi:hypothetical protein
VTRTPPTNGSQPNDGNVARLEGWNKLRTSGVGRHPRRGGDDSDDHEPTLGSPAWWNKALAAFKKYIESTVDQDASLATEDGDRES